LLAHEKKDNQTIADELGIGKNKVGRWRNRYAEGGFKALEKNLPRGKIMQVKAALANYVYVTKLFE
jgi:transposase